MASRVPARAVSMTPRVKDTPLGAKPRGGSPWLKHGDHGSLAALSRLRLFFKFVSIVGP
jgi:hypothetical protein